MALETGHKVQIAVAVIGLLATVTVALLSNMDKFRTRQPEPTYQYGLDLMAKKDFQAALEVLKPLARRGDGQAALQVGRIYLYGWGTKFDEIRANYWLNRAWKQGVEGADSSLDYLQLRRKSEGTSAEEAMRAMIIRQEESGFQE